MCSKKENNPQRSELAQSWKTFLFNPRNAIRAEVSLQKGKKSKSGNKEEEKKKSIIQKS